MATEQISREKLLNLGLTEQGFEQAFYDSLGLPFDEQGVYYSKESFLEGVLEDGLIYTRVFDITSLVHTCYYNNFKAGWHTNPNSGELLNRNKAEMLMLIVSEIAEAMEGERKNLMDDHLPNRPMAEVELADAVIRICDYAGRWGYDLQGAISEKLEYNKNRADHKIENRLKENGKKF